MTWLLTLIGAIITAIGGIGYGTYQRAKAQRAKEEAREATELNQRYSNRAQRMNEAHKLNQIEQGRLDNESTEKDYFEQNSID